MRRLALIATLLAGTAGFGVVTGAGADDVGTYRIELPDAFGIVEGSEVRVAGVKAGTVKRVEITERKRALATVELSGPLGVLGKRTTCSTEPQSLIAEYFIDCQPLGRPLEGSDDSEPDIPASRVTSTVQLDELQNTFREPFRERLRLLVNELGTGLAGGGESLSEAIRLGGPALGELRGVTRILARQRHAIRRLNVGAERLISRLAERRGDVVGTIREARDTAAVAAERRDELGRDVELLDDFIAELRPAFAELGETARAGRPLLSSLREAAPGLTELAERLPPFNDAAGLATEALGEAVVPGRAALARGRDEIRELRRAGRNAAPSAEVLADLLRDLDDPRRIVEVDARAARRCEDPGRPCYSTGRPAPTGYTGLEGLLNYVYYQTGALNQFDSVGHLLHFNLFDFGGGASPCGPWNGRPDVPAADGGRTTNILEAHPCVAWLGKNQPDISIDLGLPRYDNSVCPFGSDDPELCDPDVSTDPTEPPPTDNPILPDEPVASPARSGEAGRSPALGGDPSARDLLDFLLAP